MDPTSVKNTFQKTERLCSKKLIDELFTKGEVIRVNPVLARWMKPDTDLPARIQILVIVPKKNIRKAVDRNYLKRIIRESYRKNKHSLVRLLEERQQYLVLAVIYLGKNVIDYPKMESTILLTLDRLIKAHEASAG